jgi:hypothetical protein
VSESKKVKRSRTIIWPIAILGRMKERSNDVFRGLLLATRFRNDQRSAGIRVCLITRRRPRPTLDRHAQ